MDLIPLDGVENLTFFSALAPLDGATYTLNLRWNERATAWFINLTDETDQIQLCGDVRVVVNYPLYAASTGRQPAGLLVFVDTSGQGLDPGLNDFGGPSARVQLYYITSAELALIGQ